MRHIRLFQVGDLFPGQLNRQRTDGIFQMRDLRCPDDRRHHRLLLEQPGERDMHARNPVIAREFREPRHDLPIGLGGRIVLALRDLIGFGTQRAFG